MQHINGVPFLKQKSGLNEYLNEELIKNILSGHIVLIIPLLMTWSL